MCCFHNLCRPLLLVEMGSFRLVDLVKRRNLSFSLYFRWNSYSLLHTYSFCHCIAYYSLQIVNVVYRHAAVCVAGLHVKQLQSLYTIFLIEPLIYSIQRSAFSPSRRACVIQLYYIIKSPYVNQYTVRV